MGSISKCNEFISNIKSYYSSLPSDLQNDVEQATQLLYAYIKGSVSEGVLYAAKEVLGQSCDRSDILVFFTLMAILTGDTRANIEDLYRMFQLDTSSGDVLKLLVKNYGYLWKTSPNKSVNISDDMQRVSAENFLSNLRNKGTEDSIRSTIKDNIYSVSEPQLAKIVVEEVTELGEIVGYTIRTPYIREDLGPNSQRVPERKSVNNAYAGIARRALEDVRPAGTYMYFAVTEADLNGFDGGTFYRHLYNNEVQPWTQIQGTTIVNNFVGGYRVNVNGVNQVLSSRYDLIPSTETINIEFILVPMNETYAEDVLFMDVDDAYSDNPYGVCINENWMGCGSSVFIWDDIDYQAIARWNWSDLMKGRIYSLGVEVVR